MRVSRFVGLAALVLPLGASAGVVVNEIVPDPTGTDAGGEWVELYNDADVPIDIGGWTLEAAKTTWGVRWTFASGTTVPATGYLLIGEGLVTGADVVVPDGKLDLGNAGSNGDGVRLKNGTTVVDTLVYGPNNDDAIVDDSGAPATSVGPKPVEGQAIARSPDGVDTNASGDDFVIAAPTPKSANPAPTVCVPSAGGVTVNELLPDPVGTDGDVLLEWVELHAATEVDLGGWKLEKASKAGAWSTIASFAPGTTVLAGGFLLVGEANVPGADLLTTGAMGLFAGTGGDGVRLVDCAGTVVDTALYGGANSDLLAEDGEDVPESVGPKPGAGQSVGRTPDGNDTDASVADLVVFSSPTPKAPNPVAEVCAPFEGALVVNEALANPAGSDSAVLLEWVELYNPGTDPVDLSGWKLETAGKGGEWAAAVAFEVGDVVLGEDFFLVGETNVAGADVLVSLLALGSGLRGDGVRLVDCSGQVIDTLVYGDATNEDLVEDDSGAAATSLAPKPPDDRAVARKEDGVDTDDCGVDFWLAPEASPGAPNPRAPTCAAGGHGVVVNEFVVNPAGADADAKLEWIELFNDGDVEIDLSGWTLQAASSASGYAAKFTFGGGASIASGGFRVVGEASVVGADDTVELLALGSGSKGDGLRLVDCAGNVVDTVVYGDSNDDAVIDDSGAPAVGWAPKPGDDQSLARRVDGLDTDDSAADFWIPKGTSMGAGNPVAPVCVTGDGLVINEFLPDPAGADSTVLLEWVELYNAGAAPIDVGGWRIRHSGSSGTWSNKVAFDASRVVPPGGWLLVGEANVPGVEVVVELLGLGGGSGGDALQLVDCAGVPVDTVVYGGVNDDGHFDDTGALATSVAPSPGSGRALARKVDGVDTDLSGDDFAVATTPSPGAENPPPPECFASTGRVVVNELLSNPAGSDTEAMAEWVELYNAGDSPAKVGGWVIEVATKADEYGAKAFLPELEIPAGGFLLVGEPNVPGAGAVVPKLSLASGSHGDGVRLVDCEGNVLDTVVYGADNEDLVIDDSFAPASSLAAAPGEDQSIARVGDGVDTDLSGDDFRVSGAPTPGEPNPVIICVPSTGVVKLNELLPDPLGADGDVQKEWVELYNTDGNAVSLDGWAIVSAGKDDDWQPDFVFPPETTIGGEGFFVVGGALVEEADIQTAFSLGNATGGDAVRLLDCEGTLVDVVVYGSDNDDAITDESGAVAEPAPKPGSDVSLARPVDGADTDAPEDWKLDRSPTPGVSNYEEIPDPPDPEPCGCFQSGPQCASAPDGDAPSGGCSNVPRLPWHGLEIVPFLAAMLRRRR